MRHLAITAGGGLLLCGCASEELISEFAFPIWVDGTQYSEVISSYDTVTSWPGDYSYTTHSVIVDGTKYPCEPNSSSGCEETVRRVLAGTYGQHDHGDAQHPPASGGGYTPPKT